MNPTAGPTPFSPPVLPAPVAREVNRLAGELASLVATERADRDAILSIVHAAVSEQVDRLFTRVPVPPAVVEQARRQFDEAEVAAGLREIRESGGLALADFYDELERAAGRLTP